ncbi:DUF5777 family beta-barrel protein [Adhaeribacter soli]|uniref:DUF5777 domain-containing protein n=1 Tax=Adhaeribacter soli TaxID=2607655 RepID=A0A5N1IMI5_9BACT|nr:DUF5777 family beta-barrel protein [Adhaeribacter soli]KAA9331181.1 hypothetical protein F0P94_14920 [Adhaeribacter soli]
MRKLFRSLLLACLLTAGKTAVAQDDLLKLIDKKTDSVAASPYVKQTFRNSRIVNAPTTETLRARQLDFRITHRFGNVAGETGGYDNFFGLDEATNIRIAFDYGITDRLTIGVGRSKINGLLDGFAKYRLLRQTTENKMPVSVTAMGIAGYNSKRTSEKNINRLSYVAQAIIARKITNTFSLELVPAFLHRNLVEFTDNNNTFALGVGGKLSLTKGTALVADYYYIFSDFQQNGDFHAPLGIGLEFDTRSGHVFHMNFTNATGIMENQFLAGTRDSWFDGEFKWGFNISRIFKF